MYWYHRLLICSVLALLLWAPTMECKAMKKKEKFVDLSEMMESYAIKLCTYVAKGKKKNKKNKNKGEMWKTRCDLLAHQMEMWGENMANQLLHFNTKTMMDTLTITSPTHFGESRSQLKIIVESTVSADHPSEKNIDDFVPKEPCAMGFECGHPQTGTGAFANMNPKQEANLRSQGVHIPCEFRDDEADDWPDDL